MRALLSRRVILRFLICLGLGAALWAQDSGSISAGFERELPAFDTLDAIEVHRPHEAPTRLELSDGQWTVAPSGKMDAFALSDLQAAMRRPIGMDQRIESADADRYGFGPIPLWIRLFPRHGDPVSFEVGKVLNSNRTFVRDPKVPHVVYRLRADARRLFDRNADAWRERRIFGKTWADAQEISAKLHTGALLWTVWRPNAQAPWSLRYPSGQTAGQSEINALANTLTTLRASRFLSPKTPFKPQFELSLKLFGGQEFGLEIAQITRRKPVMVRVKGQHQSMEISAAQAVFLGASATDLQDRSLFDAQDEMPLGIEFKSAEGRLVLRRELDRWRLVHPEPAERVSKKLAEALVGGLRSTRAMAFTNTAPPGTFDAPFAVLRVVRADQTTVTIEVGDLYRKQTRYVRSSDRPRQLMIISGHMASLLRPSRRELLNLPERAAENRSP